MYEQKVIIMFVLLLSWQLLGYVSMETTTTDYVCGGGDNETCWNDDDDNVTITTEMPENFTETNIVALKNLTTTATTETPSMEIKEETLHQVQEKGCFCDLQVANYV